MATKKTVNKEMMQPKKLDTPNTKYLLLTYWFNFLIFLQSKSVVLLSIVFIIMFSFGAGYILKYPAIRGILELEHKNKVEVEYQQRKEVEDKVKAIMAWHKSDSLEAYEAILNTFNPVVMACLISQESEFNPNAISKAQALGICQVLKIHFKKGEDPFNITTNIKVGATLLKLYWDYFEGDEDRVALSLASYNAGFPLVKKIGRVPNIDETQKYVIAIDKKLKKVNSL